MLLPLNPLLRVGALPFANTGMRDDIVHAAERGHIIVKRGHVTDVAGHMTGTGGAGHVTGRIVGIAAGHMTDHVPGGADHVTGHVIERVVGGHPHRDRAIIKNEKKTNLRSQKYLA